MQNKCKHSDVYQPILILLKLYLKIFLKNLQIPPVVPIRVGEAEPPPSWDPVSTPKGEALDVMC
jgi:hypothetical protein